MRLLFASLLIFAAAPALAAPAPLKVTVDGIREGKAIPAKFAHCVPDAASHTAPGADISPGVHWSKGPKGTQSYALVAVDRDVPQKFDDANKEGTIIPARAPRRDFYHWVLIDIPVATRSLAEGAESRGADQILPPGPQAYGLRGVTSYGMMDQRQHGGYDGPCPPWNDARLHHYRFTVYALDVPSLNLKDDFGGKEALDALKEHVLAQGEVMGTYTQNRAVK